MTSPTPTLSSSEDDGVREAQFVEDGCRSVYGRTWDGPTEKMPGPEMKKAWRDLVTKAQKPTIEALARINSDLTAARQAEQQAWQDKETAIVAVSKRCLVAESEAPALRERIAKLEEALKPFGACWKPYLAAYNPAGCPGWPSMGEVMIADLKMAHDLCAVLSCSGPEGQP